MDISIKVLGTFQVAIDEQPVPVTRERVRQLVALLVAADGAWVPALDLQQELWPVDADRPKSPKSALQTIVSRTRDIFGPAGSEVIEAAAGSYRLNHDACDVDLRTWHSTLARAHAAALDPMAADLFSEARGLWGRGRFAAGSSSPSLDRERERIETARIDAVLEEAVLLEATSRRLEAASLLLSEARATPIRDDVVIAAMSVLQRSGRVTEALRLAADHRRLVREHFGSNPSPEFSLRERELLGLDETEVPISADAVDELTDRELGDVLDGADLARLATAAALGAPVRVELVAAVIDQPVELVLDSFGRAELAGVLSAAGAATWAFVDAADRERLRHQMSASDQRSVCLRAAELLDAQGADTATVARLLIAAVPLADRAEAEARASDAATQLEQSGEHRQAAELFAAAAAVADDPTQRRRLRLRNARTSEMSGDRRVASDLYDDLLSEATATADWDTLAEAALGGTAHASRVGGQAARRRRLIIADQRLPDAHHKAGEVAAELGLELLLAALRIPPELWERLRALATSPDAVGRLLALRLVVAIEEMQTGVEFGPVRDLATQAMVEIDNGVRDVEAAAALATAVHVALTHGQWLEAEQWLAALTAFGARTGEPRAQWQPLAFEAAMNGARGDHAREEQVAEQAFKLGSQKGVDDATPLWGLRVLGRAYREGSTAAFHRLINDPPPEYRKSVYPVIAGLVAFDAGHQREAVECYGEALDYLASHLDVFRPAAQALLFDLAACLETDEGIAEVSGIPARRDRRAGTLVYLGYGGPLLGPYEWFLSRRAQALGDIAGAEELLGRAVRSCRSLGVPWSPRPTG